MSSLSPGGIVVLATVGIVLLINLAAAIPRISGAVQERRSDARRRPVAAAMTAPAMLQ